MLALNFCFSCIVTLLNMLPYPSNWHNEPAFQLILGHVFRINLLGGGLALMGGAFINGWIITKWKVLVKGRFFIFRYLGASAIGELVQNIIGCFVLYVGIFPISKIIAIIPPMYLTQMAVNFILAFPGAWLAKKIKMFETKEVFDYNTNYSPFKLKSGNIITEKVNN